MDGNTIVLYSDYVRGATRKIWASIVSTTLRVELQDLGDAAEPRGEYEEVVEGISLFILRKNLGVDTNEEVLNWLKANFNKGSAIDDLTKYLDKNKISYQVSSY